MADERHPASDGQHHEIPDVADQTAVEAGDVQQPDAGRCDYEGETPPDVAGDVKPGWR